MPTKEYQPQEIEPDITIEPETLEVYTPEDTSNSTTTENPDNNVYTSETQPDDTASEIYDTITGDKNESNIEPQSTIPQINLTTTPLTETEEEVPPPDISQYTGTFTGPNKQEELLIDQQIHPRIATVGGTPLYASLDKKREIDTEYSDNTKVSLKDTIKYILTHDIEDLTKIYAPKLAKEMYNTSSEDKEIKEITNAINTYLDILEKAGILERDDATTYHDNNTTEINDQTYTLKPESHELLESAYKEALKSGIDDIPTSQANELFIDCLENKKDEIRRNTQIAYI